MKRKAFIVVAVLTLLAALVLPAAAAEEVTITGMGTCAKCGMHEADKCQTVIQVDHELPALGAHRAVDLGILGDAAATAQAAAAALQEFCASVTQAIAQSAAFNMREALEIPRIARTITIRGSNLSAEALLQIDRADLSFRMLMNSDGKHMPEIIAREESTPTFARVMQLSIDPANLEETDLDQVHAWFGTKGVHTFTLTNPDGQMAEMSFPLPPGEGQKAGTAS